MNSTSKKSIATAIFAALSADQKSRKEIICAISEQAGLSFGGASVYFNNLRKGQWGLDGKIRKVELPKIDLNALSNKQLVDMYNERSEKKIVKFRDHATAVARVTKLLEMA